MDFLNEEAIEILKKIMLETEQSRADFLNDGDKFLTVVFLNNPFKGTDASDWDEYTKRIYQMMHSIFSLYQLAIRNCNSKKSKDTIIELMHEGIKIVTEGALTDNKQIQNEIEIRCPDKETAVKMDKEINEAIEEIKKKHGIK